jgi:hypothetical protein
MGTATNNKRKAASEGRKEEKHEEALFGVNHQRQQAAMTLTQCPSLIKNTGGRSSMGKDRTKDRKKTQTSSSR